MQKNPYIQDVLKSKLLRVVLQSKDLAQLGDFLVNFIYSTVRIAFRGKHGGVHVWDSCLRDAMEIANLRSVLGKRTKPDKVADAGEALVAYAYYTELMTLDEMIEFVEEILDYNRLSNRIEEKEMCTEVFATLFTKIYLLANKQSRFIHENN